jgi:hypothetical protein
MRQTRKQQALTYWKGKWKGCTKNVAETGRGNLFVFMMEKPPANLPLFLFLNVLMLAFLLMMTN